MAKRTQIGSRGLVGAIIGVSIGLVIAFAVLPIALADAADAEVANWGTAGIAVLGLFGIVAAAGLIYYMLRAFNVLD
ncbi:MAG: hypothetical protein ACE5IJ_08825 [Thermoplasmata archaeon]